MNKEALTESEITSLIISLSWGMAWFTEKDFDDILEWAQKAKRKDCPILKTLITSSHMAMCITDQGEIRFIKRPADSYPPQ